eukprot:GDKI01013527.1.p1 GENE.GDKI01013527.1~~GDKI01013527.1.p1  ORF type:complete len:316 (-),score=89.70 GDKI01013527.1:120-1067(-)
MGSESSKQTAASSLSQPEREPSAAGTVQQQQASPPTVQKQLLQKANFMNRNIMSEPEPELKKDETALNGPGAAPGNEGMLLEFILDESGSMSSVRDSTIKAFNDYLSGQKTDKADKCIVSLTKFDAPRIIDVYTYKVIEEAPLLNHETYNPNGGTNLLDAIGATIQRTDNYLRSLGSEEEAAAKRPAVLVVVLTDGQENQSRAFSRNDVKRMIEARQAVGWTFVFLGANIDAWGEAESMGINQKNAYNFSVHNQDDLMQKMSKNTSAHRQKVNSSKATGRTYMQTKEEAFFDEEDRATEQVSGGARGSSSMFGGK